MNSIDIAEVSFSLIASQLIGSLRPVYTCLRLYIFTVFEHSYLFIWGVFTSLNQRLSFSTSRIYNSCDCHYSGSPEWVCIADFTPRHMFSEFYLMNMIYGSKRFACCYSCRKLFVTINADADMEMIGYSFESDIERGNETESSYDDSDIERAKERIRWLFPLDDSDVEPEREILEEAV